MQWDHPVFPLQSMVISTQPRSVILFGFCQKVPWHGMWCKNVMKKNSFFQHYHFLHNKFLSNDKSLQIHKHWYNYGEWLFETVLDHKISFLSFILKRRGSIFLLLTIIYILLRITFGMMSRIRLRDRVWWAIGCSIHVWWTIDCSIRVWAIGTYILFEF